MKTTTFFVLTVAVILLLAGCGSERPKPIEPVAPVAATPAPTPAPAPAPPIEQVTLTSASPFEISRQGYGLNYDRTPDSRTEGAKNTLTQNKDRFSGVSYALILGQGEGSRKPVKVVRIPANPGTEVNLDSLTLESMPASGWRMAPNVMSFVLRSEVLGKTEFSRGSEDNKVTLDAMQKSPFWWRLVNDYGSIIAEPDLQGMTTGFTPAGLQALTAYVQAERPYNSQAQSLRNDDNVASTLRSAAQNYHFAWGLFSKLPQPAQLAVMDVAGPALARYIISVAGPTTVRKYCTELSWEKIVKIDPNKDPAHESMDWNKWPHSDPDAVVAYYGMSWNEYEKVAPVMLFWGRRGQIVFEKAKAIALAQLGSTPTTPAATPRTRR